MFPLSANLKYLTSLDDLNSAVGYYVDVWDEKVVF